MSAVGEGSPATPQQRAAQTWGLVGMHRGNGQKKKDLCLAGGDSRPEQRQCGTAHGPPGPTRKKTVGLPQGGSVHDRLRRVLGVEELAERGEWERIVIQTDVPVVAWI